MTSKRAVYVWTWLPETDEPVPCGRVDFNDGVGTFMYGDRYRERAAALPLYGIPREPGGLPHRRMCRSRGPPNGVPRSAGN